jgi:hypothetical protein
MRRIGTLMLFVVLAPLIALAAMAADCPKPTDLGDGWTVTAPEQEGLDPALICGIGPRLEALKEAQAHGIVIARHGATDIRALLCRKRSASRYVAR